MHQFNAACNDIAKTAFELRLANKIELQKTVYYRIREQYHLSAQMAVRAISKTVEAYKRDKSIQVNFDLDGAMPYDQRIMSWKGLDRVSLLTLEGRLVMPIRVGEYYSDRMNRPRGQVDLIFRNKTFYLAVVVDAPEVSPIDATAVLGIDLGVKYIAVDSTGEVFPGDAIEKTRRKIDTIKADLQQCGTPSAKRHLKKIGKRESRFRRDTNHCISKKMVAKAIDTSSIIALEDLEGIRKRTTVKKSERRKHLSWGFGQLRQFIRLQGDQSWCARSLYRPCLYIPGMPCLPPHLRSQSSYKGRFRLYLLRFLCSSRLQCSSEHQSKGRSQPAYRSATFCAATSP